MKVDGLNFFPVRSVILVRLDGVRKVVPSSGSLALALRIEGDSRSKLNKISATQLPINQGCKERRSDETHRFYTYTKLLFKL